MVAIIFSSLIVLVKMSDNTYITFFLPSLSRWAELQAAL